MIPIQATEAIHASALLGHNSIHAYDSYDPEDRTQDISDEFSFESPLFSYSIFEAEAWPSGFPNKVIQISNSFSAASCESACAWLNLLKKTLLEKSEIHKAETQTQESAYVDIPSRVNNLIKEIFLPKSILAKALGVERPTLYAWLKGNIGTPRAENILRLERLEKICTLIPEEIRRTFPILRFRHIIPKGMSLEELLLDEKISPEDISTWVMQDKEAWENRAEGRGADNTTSLLSSISSPVLLEDE